jgi:hypothetical protein
MSHWCLVKFQSSTYRLPVFLVSFVEEAIFSPKCVLGTFAENQVAAAAWVYFYSILFYSILFYSILFYSILFHGSTCLFSCQYHAVFVTMAVKHNLKSGVVIRSAYITMAQFYISITIFQYD